MLNIKSTFMTRQNHISNDFLRCLIDKLQTFFVCMNWHKWMGLVYWPHFSDHSNQNTINSGSAPLDLLKDKLAMWSLLKSFHIIVEPSID